jgi:FkbM family methyltransferase
MRETVEIRTPAGKRILAFKGDEITHQIQKHGEYDKDALDSIRDVLSLIRPVTSLDIGANIGNHALVIAGLSERLFAFEPVGFVHAVLQQNLDNNGATSAKAVNVGLSMGAATKTIFVPREHNVGCSSLEERGMQADQQEIRLVAGDAFVADNGIRDIDFIKIDIEGHEGEAIAGLRQTILANQPLILMEWDQRTAEQFSAHGFFETLFAGYATFSVSRTDNKKIHPKTFLGRARRVWFRLLGKRWCLSRFDPSNGYRNIYLVPKRYLGTFAKFRYLPGT